MVLEGRLRAGERLNEVAIADKLGISRGPLQDSPHAIANFEFEVALTYKRGDKIRR